MTKEIVYINYAKCVAILCVCIGHFLPSGHLLKIILYSFHVPVFFVIAGFLFTRNSNSISFSKFINAKAKRLLVPYCFFFTLSILEYFPVDKSMIYSLPSTFLFLNGQTIWNAPLWFIPTMFIVEILFYIVVKRASASVVFVLGLCTDSIHP